MSLFSFSFYVGRAGYKKTTETGGSFSQAEGQRKQRPTSAEGREGLERELKKAQERIEQLKGAEEALKKCASL